MKLKILTISVMFFMSTSASAALEAWHGQTYSGGEGQVIFDGKIYQNEWWVGPDQCPALSEINPSNNGWRVTRSATSDELSTIGNPTSCNINIGGEDTNYDEFSFDKGYSAGDIVMMNGVTYKATVNVRPNSFSPGDENPWVKYEQLSLWENGRIYQNKDEVLGADSHRYMALFYTNNADPTLLENQNPTQQNGKPWFPKGEWHNYSPEELEEISEIDLETLYRLDSIVKYEDGFYLNKTQVLGVLPNEENPWKVYIDWGNTKELVGTPKTEWPNKFYAPYIDFVMNDVPDMAKIKNEKGVNNFVLAFIVAKNADTCMPTWGTSYPINEYSQYSKIKALRDAGGDVMVSIGGANNYPMAIACKNVNDLVEVYDGIVKNLNLKVLDFDIEGMAVADSESIERRNKALAILQNRWISEGLDIKLWYTLPIIPEGLTDNGMAVLANAKKNGVRLDGINVMTMDYGRPQCQSDNKEGQNIHGKCATDAIESLFTQVKSVFDNKSDEQIWNMLGTTPMIGYNDVQGEVFYKSDAELVLDHAKEHNIGMIGIWSMLRDRPGIPGQVSPEHSGLTAQQVEADGFSKILSKFAPDGSGTEDMVNANAGLDQVIVGPATVTLDGSASHIPTDAQSISYQWTQLAGPEVTLSNANAAVAAFNIEALNEHYEFELRVTVDGNTSRDEVSVNVTESEITPVVSIVGEHLEVNEGESITLKTTTNLTNDGIYNWTIFPNDIEYINGGSSVTFNAPNVENDVIYNVNVELTDSNGNTATDIAQLTVINVESSTGGDYEYIFPNHIDNYTSGTKVLFDDGNIYECFGDWAANCVKYDFAPTIATDPTWWMQQWRLVESQK